MFPRNYIVTCVLYNIKISFHNQFWVWISIRSTPCNGTVDDPIFALLHLLHLFCAKNALIFSTYFLQLIVFILSEIILSVSHTSEPFLVILCGTLFRRSKLIFFPIWICWNIQPSTSYTIVICLISCRSILHCWNRLLVSYCTFSSIPIF